MDLTIGPCADGGQGLDEWLAVLILLEDGFAAIAAVEHVTERAGVLGRL